MFFIITYKKLKIIVYAWQLINVISKGKMEYLSPEAKEKFQPSLNHVFKIACLINVMEGKSVLSTS